MKGWLPSVLAAALLGASPAPAAEIRVFAAASLTDAFREVGTAWERDHPGDRVDLVFAGSQVLRTQIEQGARADVFASADLDHAEALRRAGLLGEHRTFAHNALVVVAPAGVGKVARLQDLARPGVKLVVAGPSVPAGRYTAQAIEGLARPDLLGPAFAAGARANVVSQETNVRIVLSKVALGEADAGFVYRSDALSAPGKVRVLELPGALRVTAEYAIGVLARSEAPEGARGFMAFVLGKGGQAILRRYGFAP